MIGGRWTEDSGQRMVDRGRWTGDGGQGQAWTLSGNTSHIDLNESTKAGCPHSAPSGACARQYIHMHTRARANTRGAKIFGSNWLLEASEVFHHQ